MNFHSIKVRVRHIVVMVQGRVWVRLYKRTKNKWKLGLVKVKVG